MVVIIVITFNLLWFALTTVVGSEGVSTKINLTCSGCNVILLDIDLLRADAVGLREPHATNTPNIDNFFKNSIIFEDVSASSGVTAISNTATLMARDGFFIYDLLKNTYVDQPPQMPYKYKKLFSGLPTIAEILHGNGYETINANNGWYAGRQMLLDRGIDRYWGSGEVGATENIPAQIIGKTAEFIKEKNLDSKKFYLLMRSEDLRGLPYRYPSNRSHISDPRIQYRERSEGYFEVIYQLRPDGKLTVQFPTFAKADWMSSAQIQEYQMLSKALYAQQLAYIDEELGKLFKVLESGHLLEKTIVVLYSNHGDGLYDNNVPNHGVSYQSCVSVPVFIRHPKINKQIRISEAVALIDLIPTIYDMLSIIQPEGLDGISLINLIKGGKYSKTFFFGIDKESQYVRHGTMKLIVWADKSKELYDLEADPKELNSSH